MARETDDCLRKEEEDEEEEEEDGGEGMEDRTTQIMDRRLVEGLSISLEEEEEEEEEENGDGTEDREEEDEEVEVEENCEERRTKIVERKWVDGAPLLVQEEEENERNVDEEEEEEEGDKENEKEEEEGEEEEEDPEETHQRKWIIDERQKTNIFNGKLLESDERQKTETFNGEPLESYAESSGEGEDMDEDREDEGEGEGEADDENEEVCESEDGTVNFKNYTNDNGKHFETIENEGEENDTEIPDYEDVPNCTLVGEGDMVYVKASADRKDKDHDPESEKEDECFADPPSDGEGACDSAEDEECVPSSISANENVSDGGEESECDLDSERSDTGTTPQCGRDGAPSTFNAKESECIPAEARGCKHNFESVTRDIYTPGSGSGITNMVKDHFPDDARGKEELQESDRDNEGDPQSDINMKGVLKSSGRNSDIYESDKDGEGISEGDTDNECVPESDKESDHVPESDIDNDHAPESARNTEDILESVRDFEYVPESDNDGDMDGEDVLESERNDEGVVESERNAEDVLESERDDEGVLESERDDEGVLESERNDEGVLESERDDEDVLESERDDEGVLESERDGEGVLESEKDNEYVPQYATHNESVPESATDIEDNHDNSRDTEDPQGARNTSQILNSDKNRENVPGCATHTEHVLENDRDTDYASTSAMKGENVLESDSDSEDVLENDVDGDVLERPIDFEDVLESAMDAEGVLECANNNDLGTAFNTGDGTPSATDSEGDAEGVRSHGVPENTKNGEDVPKCAADHQDTPDGAMHHDAVPAIVRDCVDAPQRCGDKEYTTDGHRGGAAAVTAEEVPGGGSRSAADPHTSLNGESIPSDARKGDGKHRTDDGGRTKPVSTFERVVPPPNNGARRSVIGEEDYLAAIRGVEGEAWPIERRIERRRGNAGERRGEVGEGRIPWRAGHKEQQVADPLACLRQRPAPLPGPRCTCGTTSSPWKARSPEASLVCIASEQQHGVVPQTQLRGLTLSLAAAAEETELTCVEHKSLSDLQDTRKRGAGSSSKSFMSREVNRSPERAVDAHPVSRTTTVRGVFVPGGGPLGLAPPQTLALAPSSGGSRISASCYTLFGPRPTGRKGVRSCILPGGSFLPSPAPFVPLPGTLRSRVQSEPNVSGRLVSHTSASPRLATPRGLSQLFSSRRKSIAACIFPTTAEEDTAPYVKASAPAIPRGPASTWGNTASLRDKQGLSSPIGVWDSPRQGCCGASPLCPAPRFAATDPRPRQARSARRRPQSLVIIPETQVAWAPEPATTAPKDMSRLEWGSQSLTTPEKPLPTEEKRKLYRGSGRSLSFSPADGVQPVRAQASPPDPATKGPRRTASLRGLFTSSSLRSAE